MTELVKTLGTSIRIFLASGGADGVWVVEKSNWTGKGLMASRTRYKDLRARPDLDGPGVYVLVGPTESGIPQDRIYIGETDDLPSRLDTHNKNKDFWDRVIVFTSKDENLNKAHIRHIEARLILLAKAAGRAELENGNVSSAPPLSEADTADAEFFLAEMLLIYPVLGVLSFQKAADQASSSQLLYLSSDGATIATGNETPNGFLVRSGSLARADPFPGLQTHRVHLRETLLSTGVFVKDGPNLRLTSDYLFNTPSSAASIMLGTSTNGRLAWKTGNGKTLKELQEDLALDHQ